MLRPVFAGRNETAKGRILITSSVADAESLSTCEVFQLLLQAGTGTQGLAKHSFHFGLGGEATS